MEWESLYKEVADYNQAGLGASKKKTQGNMVICIQLKDLPDDYLLCKP